MAASELLAEMLNLSDEEIIALAKEMDIPVKKISDTKLEDKNATVIYLIKGGCNGCNRK